MTSTIRGLYLFFLSLKSDQSQNYYKNWLKKNDAKRFCILIAFRVGKVKKYLKFSDEICSKIRILEKKGLKNEKWKNSHDIKNQNQEDIGSKNEILRFF